MKNILHADDINPEIQAVKAAIKLTKDKRMFERYQAIWMYLHGVKYDRIAIIIEKSTASIGHYVKAYREDGLTMGQSPPFLSHEQEEELVNFS